MKKAPLGKNLSSGAFISGAIRRITVFSRIFPLWPFRRASDAPKD